MLDCRYVRLLVRRTTGTSDYKIYCRTTGPSKKIKVNGQELEAVTSFKYLGSVITDEGSKHEILSRIAHTTAALTRLKPVWVDKSISLSRSIVGEAMRKRGQARERETAIRFLLLICTMLLTIKCFLLATEQVP